MGTHLGRRARKNSLDDCQIQESIVTAASNETQSRVQNLPQHGCIAVQPIQTNHDLGEEKFVRRRIAANRLQSAFEFSPVVPIARSPKRPPELMGMCLQNRGPGSHDFPSLASFVTRSRHLGETPMGYRKRGELGERTLAGSLSRAVYIHDDIRLSAAIPQAPEEAKGVRATRSS